MRRKEKEITEPEIIYRILETAPALRIAMCDESGPYIVAMHFGWEPGRIYLHSALEGRKLAILKRDNRVAFQTDIDVEIIPGKAACAWTTKYLSLVGHGRACFVENTEEKKYALDVIMSKYSGFKGHTFASEPLEKTCVIRIDIEEMTGKRLGIQTIARPQ